MSKALMGVTFSDPTAENLGDAFGIPLERQNELGQNLDQMIAHFSPASGIKKVHMAQLVAYIQDFCNTNEEFIYSLMNHMAWLYRTGRAVPPKSNKYQ